MTHNNDGNNKKPGWQDNILDSVASKITKFDRIKENVEKCNFTRHFNVNRVQLPAAAVAAGVVTAVCCCRQLTTLLQAQSAVASVVAADDVDTVVAAAAAGQQSGVSHCTAAERPQDDVTAAAVISLLSFLQHPMNGDQSI